MKTRASHLIKSILMLALAVTLMVSCGKENKSGDDNNSNQYSNGNYGGFQYGNINNNGMNLPQNWQTVVMNENPCSVNYQNGSPFNNNSNTGRQIVVIPLTGINVNQGSVHVGVTPQGDVGIVSNQNNGPVIELHLCQRPDITGRGGLSSNPVLNTSSNCPLSEVTSLDVSLEGNPQFAAYLLQFAPIHIQNTDRRSSLCR